MSFILVPLYQSLHQMAKVKNDSKIFYEHFSSRSTNSSGKRKCILCQHFLPVPCNYHIESFSKWKTHLKNRGLILEVSFQSNIISTILNPFR